MSHYVECQTEFRDVQALVAALKASGFEAHQIESHQEAVPLSPTQMEWSLGSFPQSRPGAGGLRRWMTRSPPKS
jgi:hypothetical protein